MTNSTSDEQARADERECGVAATLLGGFASICAMVALVFNCLLAVHGHTIMRPFEVRLHAIGAVVVICLMLWAAARGLQLSGQAARGPAGLTPRGLAIAGWTMSLIALVLWLIVAISEAFVVSGLW